MTPEFVATIGKHTIEVALIVSAPILISGMVVGLIVSILQAVTQIQEMTLTFVPKIIAVFIALIIFAPWMMEAMVRFTAEILNNLPVYIK